MYILLWNGDWYNLFGVYVCACARASVCVFYVTYNKGVGTLFAVSKTIYLKHRFIFLFGENSQAVAYSAQTLCWSG